MTTDSGRHLQISKMCREGFWWNGSLQNYLLCNWNGLSNNFNHHKEVIKKFIIIIKQWHTIITYNHLITSNNVKQSYISELFVHQIVNQIIHNHHQIMIQMNSNHHQTSNKQCQVRFTCLNYLTFKSLNNQSNTQSNNQSNHNQSNHNQWNNPSNELK
jgi:hypothetical protein